MTHLLSQIDIISNKVDNVKWHIRSVHQANKVRQSIQPWQEPLIDEIILFSKYLFKHQKVQAKNEQHQELIALAFWCRTSNLKSMQSDYHNLSSPPDSKLSGKIFHIAPANVDTVFFYSLIISILSGNENIVRISERSGQLCRELVAIFTEFLKQTNSLIYLPRLVSIVEYSATHVQATETFSQWCNLRVIWGGDKAIAAISQIAPETTQLCFPDRYSIAVCHLQKSDNIEEIARHFIADFLPFSQQACSSPKALFWLNTAEDLQNKFLDELQRQLTAHQQQFTLSDHVERQINIQQILMKEENKVVKQHCYKQLASYQLETISSELLEVHQGNGLLLIKNINSVFHLPFSKKLQTISCFGLHLTDISIIEKQQHKRITALGQALLFNHIWDGVNLLNKLIPDLN